eukprot:19226-Heterococcus_DN1.PRE.2
MLLVAIRAGIVNVSRNKCDKFHYSDASAPGSALAMKPEQCAHTALYRSTCIQCISFYIALPACAV